MGQESSPASHDDTHDESTDIDAETAALVAKLALEDLETVYGRRHGKSRVGGAVSDEEYAYQLQAQHFQEMLTRAEDAKIAKSLRDAVATDSAYVEALRIAEEAAAEDRRAALALSRGEQLPAKTAAQIRLEDPTFVLHPDPPSKSERAASKAKAPADVDEDVIYVSSDDETDTIVLDDSDEDDQFTIAYRALIDKSFRTTSTSAGPSVNRTKSSTPSSAGLNIYKSNTTTSASISSKTRVECTICTDTVRATVALHTPCGDYYCQDCLRSLVELFTRDESLYPLRCCQQSIPISTVIPFISSGLRKIFEAKNAEFSVFAKDRIYCCNPVCSTFLGSSEGRERVNEVICTVSTCRTSTCPRCKQAGHPADPDCAVNHATIELRALARQQGWQTCPGCHTLIELNVGCYHMTCRCRTEFCYLCAVPWKKCTCPQWDEERLLVTAQQRVDNEIGNERNNIIPAMFLRRVQERIETLRVNHHCERHSWRYRSGGGVCEECNFHLPNYLLICTGCSLLACVRCSRNRF